MTYAQLPILAVVPSSGLLFGLILVAAIVGGHAARLVRLPRVVGFLLGGVFLHLGLAALVGSSGDEAPTQALEAAARPLKPIKDLALGLILFTIGGMFERPRLRAAVRRVLRIGLLEITAVTLMVFVGCVAVSFLVRVSPAWDQNLVLSLLLATAAIATAPAATLFVLREYEAKGHVTETILGLTAMNNIICIVLFQVTFLLLAAAGVIRTTGSVASHPYLALLCSTVGSLVLGILVGTLISIIHGRFPLAETLLFFFALFIVLGAGEEWLWQSLGVSYNFLLTALVIGAIFSNLAIDARKLGTALSTFGSPIFAGFFVMAGYELHLDDLAAMGWMGSAYVLARSTGKWLGCKLGIRWAREPERAEGRLGGALLCQAAVVIGLAGFVEQYWDSELASRFTTIILGSVVIFEMVGPLLVKRCVVQAGEVKASTLLRREEGIQEAGSITWRTIGSLGRLFGLGRSLAGGPPGSMRVEHIMRTNVQLIPADATFDEVLHAIERSTHSHFPVVGPNSTYAGVIHFSDVHDVIYDPTLSRLVTAVDLADEDSATVPVDLPLSELLDLFNKQGVAAFPVVDQEGSRRIVGLVEQRDLLRALHLSQSLV